MNILAKWMTIALVLAGPAAAGPERYTAQEGGSEESRQTYQQARKALDDGNYEEAAGLFAEVAQGGDYRPDGAHYWQAYALRRLGRAEQALEILGRFFEKYPESSWKEEARALRSEIRGPRASGVGAGRTGASAGELSEDDDLKMAVVSGLMHSDPEKALPILEKLLQGDGAQAVKNRALFVLAQYDLPRARELLEQVARGGQGAELQLKALQYLGLHRGKEGLPVLESIYRDSSDLEVKRRILQSFMLAGAKDRLLTAARGESDRELRRHAIQQLGVIGAGQELSQLYRQEQDEDLRSAILNALFVSGEAGFLESLARSESNPELRRKAIQKLGLMGESTTDTLLEIYKAEQSTAEEKRAVLNALFLQQNASALIDLYKNESGHEMKKTIVQKLSLINSDEAREFLLKILENEA